MWQLFNLAINYRSVIPSEAIAKPRNPCNEIDSLLVMTRSKLKEPCFFCIRIKQKIPHYTALRIGMTTLYVISTRGRNLKDCFVPRNDRKNHSKFKIHHLK